ncbi:MAG TPA: GntR family transcriptional regulator [Syntrophorhabdaceae bacterium]|jgi:DNA-binding FadR family transcriptional regulator
MPTFKPIRQHRVSARVAEQLKKSIIVAELKPGDKLPSERELAEEFQVSRVAIHEALRSLEGSGFIVTRQGPAGGSFVTDLSFERSVNAFQDLFVAEKISIEEVHHVRSVVEAEIARLAASRVTDEYARRLRDSLSGEELTVESLATDITRKMAVHFILAEMCGNRFLEALERTLMGLIRIAVETMDRETGGDFDLLKLHPEAMHRPIIDAVIAGDGEAAAVAAKEHAFKYGENLRQAEKAFRERRTGQAERTTATGKH